MSIEALIPPYLAPQAEQPQLLDNATAVFTPMQAPGIPQRVSFVEPQLQVKQSWQALRGSDRAAMMAALARLKGKYGTLRAAVGYTLRGSFPTGELLPHGMFDSGTTGWTGGNAGLAVNDRMLRVTASGSAGILYASAGIVAVTSGAAYVARTCLYPARNINVNSRVMGPILGTAAGGATLAQGQTNSSGLMKLTWSATVSSVYFGIACSSGPAVGGDSFDCTYTSLARCALVNSVVAANAMTVGALPTSTSGLLLADDLVCINGELKRCVAQLDSDGSGVGYLQYAPTMFSTPSSGNAVEIFQPIGKFILGDNPSWTNDYGVYADLDLTLQAINE